jgi:hypothetical protein
MEYASLKISFAVMLVLQCTHLFLTCSWFLFCAVFAFCLVEKEIHLIQNVVGLFFSAVNAAETKMLPGAMDYASCHLFSVIHFIMCVSLYVTCFGLKAKFEALMGELEFFHHIQNGLLPPSFLSDKCQGFLLIE